MKNFFYLIILLLFSTKLSADKSYLEEGMVLFENKNFKEAKFKFEQDIVFNPKSEKSYLYLAKIFNKQKKRELEENNLNTVILLNPKNEEAIYSLAQLKLKESDYSESKKLVENLLVFCKKFCQKSQQLKIEIENSLKK